MRALHAALSIGVGLLNLGAGTALGQVAADHRPSGTSTLDLWPAVNGPTSRGATGGARLTVFTPPHAAEARPAMIVCPGGGYTFVSLTKEGWPIANRLNSDGFATFVLEYRLPKGVMPPDGSLPTPEQDVLRAVQCVRLRAAEWNIDPNRIGVMGFSAGGHVAAMASTMFDDAKRLPGYPAEPVSRVSARPDFAILLYPVISMEADWAHAGSRAKLIGATAGAATTTRYSVDERVDSRTSPLFIAVARDDKTVKYHNSELMAAAADKAGVPAKLLVFEHGGHGFGLGDNAETRTWYPACLAWLKQHQFLKSSGDSHN